MKVTYHIAALIVALLLSQLSIAMELPGPLISTDWLAKNSDKVTILDIRNDTKSFTAKPVFHKDKKTNKKKLVKVGGHIPGALLVNYKKIRSNRIISGKEVTRMLPERRKFEELMQSIGLNKDAVVVIVSEGQGNGDMSMATRLYWQLKYYGQDNMAILDGGTAQWIIDNKPVNQKAGKSSKGNWQATAERTEILATSEDVSHAIASKDTQLMDTRMLSLYLGTWRKKSYVYSDGHIPGAKPFPNELLTQPTAPAKFISATQAKQLATTLGINTEGKIITYCNSGHLASGSWFLMSEVLGNKNVKLYDGSMHQWTLEKGPTKTMEME